MYNINTVQKVKAELENRRLGAISEAEGRNLEVRRRSERIANIDKELTKTGLLLFRTACAGEDIAPLRLRNQALCQKRREELVKLGYPADYTEVHYTCSLCSDTGFNGTEICRCQREMLILEGIKASGIGHLIEKQSFENFDLHHYARSGKDAEERMRSNFETAKVYAENFAQTRGNLLFMGPTGTGKTHLSTAIAKTVISKGFSVLYDSAQAIVSAYENDRFRSGYGKSEPESDKYTECDLLIVDDLGTEFVSPFTISCLYNLFNTRQNRGLSTIVSTNLSPKELTTRYEDRIYSRIVGSDYNILSFTGEDYRLMP